MASLSTAVLTAVFLVAAVATWVAGTQLSKTTDALDDRFGLGDALGGLVLLGFATSLPELAIVVSAAVNHHLDIIVGNLIGGIAIQTALIALLDARGPREAPITYLAGSLTLVVEAATVVAVGVLALGGTQIPGHVSVAGVSPVSVALVAAWVLGLLGVNSLRKGEPWKATAPGAPPGRRHRSEPRARSASAPESHPFHGRSTGVVLAIFAVGSIVTLGAGYLLEEGGNELAGRMGLSSGIFGATVLALVTALPGISTGFAAIRLGDYGLSLSEMFGGNAFAPTLFIFGDLVAGTPVLAHAQRTDLWMAALGVTMTAIFIVSFIVRPRRKRLRLGADSMLAVLVYALGIAGLATIPGS